MSDAWVRGDAYERFMGRWSRLVAPLFVDWLDQPPGLRWVDLGCGTGALTGAVLERASPVSVHGVDPSAGFLETARALQDDARARFSVGDALDLRPVSADVVVSGLALTFIPDLPAALRAVTAAAPGGVVAAYVWDYAEGMRMLRTFWDAAVEVEPAGAGLDEGRARFPLAQPVPLAEAWEAAGLTDVSTTGLEVRRRFERFEELWAPFRAGAGPAPAFLATLRPDQQAAVRVGMRRLVTGGLEGPFDLSARAWAVRGTAPA
ncbi:MAG TPA: class I SAM-dependent methyltransferase [Dermatophilaceae bacterium]|nr:class I SAM-dependent methyltransferase [Dermatophilaceae bacterium]